MLVLDKLNSLGIRNVNEVIFDQNFSLNWQNNPQLIKQQLIKIFNTHLWSAQTNKAFEDLNDYLYEQTQSQILKPEFMISKVSYQNTIALNEYDEMVEHFSSPLYKQLKPINMYSNNFYTDQLFEFLGGKNLFAEFMYRYFSATEDNIKFYTGSGLGENYTTCKLTLNLLEELENYADYNQFPLESFISVAGVDEGTLNKRFTNSNYRNRLIAKTGTLRHTSALAGYINGHDKVRFALFNHTYNITGARELQNQFIQKILDNHLDSNEIDYIKKEYPSVRDIIIQ
jgi:D-alanyl-D-alanine carboxypeptidase/D-alanyl-D-alanine-endopeptidase (penicillin-binding protein 4)